MSIYKKKRNLLSLTLCALLIFGYSNILSASEEIIHCPMVNNISVNIKQKTASAPGNWVGTNNIPPEHVNDWRQLTKSVGYNMGGICQYLLGTGPLEVVRLHKTDFPANYHLYDLDDGYNQRPLGDCGWYIPRSGYPNCYYAARPVILNK
jgi:hypothetical protein